MNLKVKQRASKKALKLQSSFLTRTKKTRHSPQIKRSFPYSLVFLAFISLVAKKVKNLPAMQETRVGSLGWEDLLEKGIATPSRILIWKIPWTEEPGVLESTEWQRVGHD